MKTKWTSTVLLFLTAMIWGFAFVAQVDGAEHLPPFMFNGIRFLLGAVVLLPVIALFEKGKSKGQEKKRTCIAALSGGTALFIASTLQQFGIQMTRSAGISGFITGLYTVLVPIACFLLFRQRTGAQVWIGAALAVIGLFFVCYRPGSGLAFGLGELLLLIGALFWTAHVIIIDRLGKGVRSLRFACGQSAVCGLWSVLGMLLFEDVHWSSIWNAKFSLLFCGVFSVGIAYTLQVVAQKRSDPTFAAIVLSTESVFGAIGGALFGVDRIVWLGYVGFLLIFCGIVLSQLPEKKSRKTLEGQAMRKEKEKRKA